MFIYWFLSSDRRIDFINPVLLIKVILILSSSVRTPGWSKRYIWP